MFKWLRKLKDIWLGEVGFTSYLPAIPVLPPKPKLPVKKKTDPWNKSEDSVILMMSRTIPASMIQTAYLPHRSVAQINQRMRVLEKAVVRAWVNR